MLWAYSVKGNEFVAEDVTSLKQLKDVAHNQWVWIDIFNPDEKELEIITELISNDSEVVEKYQKIMGKPLDLPFTSYELCTYEKVHECTIITVPSITLEKQMLVYPIVLVKKKKMIITWGEEGQSYSSVIKKSINRLREGVETEQTLNSSLVISVLFHEIAVKNSAQLLSIREKIDQLEERALAKGEKNLLRSIFSLKKIISNIYRLLIEEKDFMLDVTKSVIPLVKLDQKSKPIVDAAIEVVDREIDFVDSYNRSLDSILTLTNLASIHKVESSINYLTIVLVIGTAILIFLELLAVLELA